MSNSPLVSYVRISPNTSGLRNKPIDMFTPHCVVGQATVQTLGNIFANPKRQASSNYGIGTNGDYGMYCEEKNRSWCSSSSANDNRAVTVECASDAKDPYAFNQKVYSALIQLGADVCKRNGKDKILWLGSKEATWNYKPKSNEMLLSVHRWYDKRSCPGDWLYSRMDDLANKINICLGSQPIPTPVPTPVPTPTPTSGIILGKYYYKGVDYGYVFNPNYYAAHQLDVVKDKYFGKNDKTLFEHFCKHGMKEGRQANDIFNVYIYQQNYSDLRLAYGNKLPKYYEHFCRYGYKEGRKASYLFSNVSKVA